jgi:hypothetical protein
MFLHKRARVLLVLREIELLRESELQISRPHDTEMRPAQDLAAILPGASYIPIAFAAPFRRDWKEPGGPVLYTNSYINDLEWAGGVSVVSVVNLKKCGLLAEPYLLFY